MFECSKIYKRKRMDNFQLEKIKAAYNDRNLYNIYRS